MIALTPGYFTFNGMYCVLPPYCFRPTTRLAYCTVIFRTPCVIAITPAITQNRNRIIRTRTMGLTWLLCPPLGTNVLHSCASADGNVDTIPIVMRSEERRVGKE